MTALPRTVEEMEALIKGMAPAQRSDLEAKVRAFTADKPWIPQPGPQTEAFYGKAEQTLYGGAAGGGKTDLLLGLATTQHERTVLFRRQSVDLDTIWNRLTAITAGRVVKSDANKKKMRLNDGRFIEFGHLEKPGSEKGWQGNAHDLYAFDEAAQLDEMKVAFVIQWLRTTTEGQRGRVVFATNPPIPEFDKDGRVLDTGTGAWLMEWFAPWLEDAFPDPAKDGELRWCFMRTEGDRLVTIWVPGPGGYDPETAEPWPNYTQEDVRKGRVSVAFSRTFVRSLLENNVFLKDSGYAERLSATPEPLRSLLLNGSFTVKGEDHPMQVIPTLWVLAAQQRWRDRKQANDHKNLPQLVLAADIAQGGMDTTVLASLRETDWFDELVTQPGRKTPTGEEVLKMLVAFRTDRSMIVLDGDGGWGGSTRDLLARDHKIEATMFRASAGSHGWTDDMLYRYKNGRAEIWWEFRKALDPKSGYEICLPPSTRLATQLTAPIWRPQGREMIIESKEDLRTRIGTSTDEADAILMAWHYRNQALAERVDYRPDIVQRIVHGKTSKQMREEANQASELDDPLSQWR